MPELARLSGTVLVILFAGSGCRAPEPPTLVEYRVDGEGQARRVDAVGAPSHATAKASAAAPVARSQDAGAAWAVVVRPGRRGEDTPETRAAYARDVLKQAPGEPSLDRKAAMALLEKLRASVARRARVPAASIHLALVDDGGSLSAGGGVASRFDVDHDVRTFGVCSEAFLSAALQESGLQTPDFAAVGLRGVTCHSDGCAAVFDMRPTTTNGSLYDGEDCLSTSAMLRITTR